MKKIILTLLGAAALLGCNREDLPPKPELADAIAFNNVATRAVDSASDIEEFEVWTTITNSVNSYLPLMSGERVYRNPAGSDNWTYVNTEYWLDQTQFYFFAAYPYNLGFTEHRQQMNENYYTMYSLDVEADGSADTEDILTAFAFTDTSVEGYATTVPLTFGHLLSKINFKISQNFDIDNDFNYYVKKVTVTGLKGSGTYILLPYYNSENPTQSYFEYWDTDSAQPLTLVKEYTDPVPLRNLSAADPKVVLSVFGDDGLMVIPQNIESGDVTVRVDYLYDVNLDDDDKGSEKFVEATIPNFTLLSGKRINFSMQIASQSLLTFSAPSIDPWGAPQTGGTIIIK